MAEVTEGVQFQTITEQISYTVLTTGAGGTPTSVAVTAIDLSNANTDVTATVLPTNTPTVSTDTITLSLLKSLTADHIYRVRVSYTSNGNEIDDDILVQATA